jgi:hypothetical protein
MKFEKSSLLKAVRSRAIFVTFQVFLFITKVNVNLLEYFNLSLHAAEALRPESENAKAP